MVVGVGDGVVVVVVVVMVMVVVMPREETVAGQLLSRIESLQRRMGINHDRRCWQTY